MHPETKNTMTTFTMCSLIKFQHSKIFFFSVALWMSNLHVTTSTCPARCRCVDQENAVPTTYCAGLRLPTVPRGVVNKTEYLSLRVNNIRKIERNDFKHLRQLRRLNLMHNALVEISPKAFKHLGQLRSLNLAHNRLRHLPPKIFDYMPNLEELLLNDNYFTDLPEDLFSSLPKLKRLHLHNNQLNRPTSTLFNSLRNLQELKLSKNRIDSIERNTFMNLHQLVFLELDDNWIKTIAFESFEHLTTLSELHLANNKLQTIHGGLFDGKSKLSKISVYGNPLICDCNVRWLHKTFSMGFPEILRPERTVCKLPQALDGKVISDLSADNLQCYGTWTGWGEWTKCDKECNSGLRYRSRECDTNARSGDICTCKGESAVSERCNVLPCLRGVLTRWSEWGPCSSSCKDGFRLRMRSCINPYTGSEADICQQPTSEMLPCNEGECPIDGQWSSWSSWTDCSEKCGIGTERRTRTCTSPQPRSGGRTCKGGHVETQNKVCIKALCSPRTHWSEWSDYTPCSVSCGIGSQSRKRNCLNEYNVTINIINICPGPSEQTIECRANSLSCVTDGNWSAWSEWSKCDAYSCQIHRTRSCTRPIPMNGGRECTGISQETKSCDPSTCVIHAVWNSWQGWSLCSASCNGGTRTRFRSCPGEDINRVTCGTKKSETELCNTFPCNWQPRWSAWSTWSECNGGCHGKRVRRRKCHGDKYHKCKGRDKEREHCISTDCQINKDDRIIGAPSKCIGRGNIENGYESLTQNGSDGLIAEYSCKKFYKLKGISKTMSCTKGQWTPAIPPYCVPACGRPSFLPNNHRARLLGGTLAAPHSWPWQVAIEVRIPGEGWKLRCGGSLINDQWILTAGHCLFHKNPRTKLLQPHEFKIFLKLHNVSARYEDPLVELAHVKYAVAHPKFDYPSLDHDLGLIKLKKKVVLDEYASPVCLPSSKQRHLSRKGQIGTVVGWGVTLRQRASQLLQELQLPVVSRKECEFAYKNKYNITQSMFCAGTQYGGYDTCKGDSGGGFLFYDYKRKKWTVQGIVSWGGYRCGEVGKYSVYTKVSLFTNWIRKILRQDEFSKNSRST